MSTEQLFAFDIEGPTVVCYRSGEDRLWRCECAEFQQTLATCKEAFWHKLMSTDWRRTIPKRTS